MPYRPSKTELLDLIESMKNAGRDVTEFQHELETIEPVVRRPPPRRGRVEDEEPTLADRLNNRVGDLFDNNISDELVATVIEMDRNHSFKELKEMCVKAGLSASGDKKELAAKLIAHNAIGGRE